MSVSPGIAVAIVATLLLSACSSNADTKGESAVQTTGPDGWRVSATGFGPLKAGQSVAEAAAAVGGSFIVAAGASPECSYAEWSSAPEGVRVMLVNDTVARVDVTSATVSTAQGAKVGDNEGRINSLYATKVLMMPHKYTTGKYMVITQPEDTLHRIVFETDGQQVTQYRAGREPEVQWVEGCS